MQLRLILDSAESAAFLKFEPPSGEVSRYIQSEPKSIPELQENSIDAYVSFKEIKDRWPQAPVLHICRQFAILHLKQELSQTLLNAITNPPLYAFSEDENALSYTEAHEIRQINWLHEFYNDKAWAKVIVVSRAETVNSIMASAPEAFVHFVFTQDGIRVCLGTELLQDRGDYLRAALKNVARIAKSLSDRKSLPFMIVQGCLAQAAGSSYGFFADRYDRYMSHVDYDKWFNLISGWQKKYGNKAGTRVLELACGTAAVASRFVQAGYQVYGCDLSAQMLENADKRALKPILYQAALTDPIPHQNLDLVICVFDSINYLLQAQDILKCLQEVSKALAPDGIFIFDISTLLNSMENFSDVCSISRERDALMIHEAGYEPGKRRQISRLELFKEQGAGYSHQSELHSQRVYLVKEIVEIIKESGMSLKAIHSSENPANLYPRKMQGIDHRYYRLFFVMGK